MDVHLSTPNPFTYLVGEHARAIVAIQDLQREVHSLLSFREHVLEAFPHLCLHESTTRARPPPQTHGGKSLSEGPPTVADSGFSTDKASTSMGKSSSSSSGELSGTRWSPGEGPYGASPLGSAEDELLTLLEVIERKGNRLRKELEKAEEKERAAGPSSDPGGDIASPSADAFSSSGRWKGSQAGDWWPHSLPGAGHRLDFVPGLEAWGEVERLRVDRQYLMGRLQRAEAEGGAAHQRLLDLHAQLLSLASEKRRLEEAFRSALVKGGTDSSNLSYSSGAKPRRGVTVTTIGKKPPSSPTNMDDATLPRVLRVPIKDKWSSKPPSKIPLAPKRDSQFFNSSPRSVFRISSSNSPTPRELVSSNPDSEDKTGRVVIEGERTLVNRADGGLSMPVSLIKGARIAVKPDRHRISAILKEKDVLSLQKQLLTTVMETEVLRRQIEVAGEEWGNRLSEWESEKKQRQEQHVSLQAENISLKNKLSDLRNVKKIDIGVSVQPASTSVGIGTNELEGDEEPSYFVHSGPNVKYDVVIYDERKSHSKEVAATRSGLTFRKPTPPVEKPPRRTRPLSAGAGFSSHISTMDSLSYGKDSLGRITRIPLRTNVRTPSPATSNPRHSSPSSSISSRYIGAKRISPKNDATAIRGSSSSTREPPIDSITRLAHSRGTVGRRNSLKLAVGCSNPPAVPVLVPKNATTSTTNKMSNFFQTGTARRRWRSKVEDLCGCGSSNRDASCCREVNSRCLIEATSFLDCQIANSNDESTRILENSFDSSSDSVSSLLESPSDLLAASPQTWQTIHSNSFTPNRAVHNGTFHRQWVKPFSPRDSLESSKLDLYGADTLGFSCEINGKVLLSKLKKPIDYSPRNRDFSMHLRKFSYKAMQRNYSRGVLRLKKGVDRPSVLPRGDGSPPCARSD